jgi:hypothetical protein
MLNFIPNTLKSLPLLFLALTNMASADSSVTITLQGSVDTQCFATLQATAIGQSLDLTQNSTDDNVAAGTLFCNDPDGFVATLTTQNGQADGGEGRQGLFEHSTDPTEANQLPYDLQYASDDATPIPLNFVNGVVTVVQGDPGATINNVFSLLIGYTGNSLLQAGIYQDQLTFAIIAN